MKMVRLQNMKEVADIQAGHRLPLLHSIMKRREKIGQDECKYDDFK